MPRRIGINLLYLVPGQVGGTEIYARRLVDALARLHPEAHFAVFCGAEAAAALAGEGWPENVEIVSLRIRCAVKPLRLAAELALLPLVARRHAIDVLHSLGTTTPLLGWGRRVVTVHDLIYAVFPESFPPAARLVLKALVPLGARRAHRVQVSSEATRVELIEAFGLPREGIDVVHLGVGMRTATAPTPEPVLRERLALGAGPVVLTVAAALPHKNLERLLAAFATLHATRPAARLVVVGHSGRRHAQLQAEAARLGLGDAVTFTGWIEDADLEGLYALAAAFAYPSLHEGFGMPVLEAMRRGVPVACANTTSLPEVAGDAALLFDPRSVPAIAGALERLLGDEPLRADLVARGPEHAAHFTWERTAATAWASYERA